MGWKDTKGSETEEKQGFVADTAAAALGQPIHQTIALCLSLSLYLLSPYLADCSLTVHTQQLHLFFWSKVTANVVGWSQKSLTWDSGVLVRIHTKWREVDGINKERVSVQIFSMFLYLCLVVSIVNDLTLSR